MPMRNLIDATVPWRCAPPLQGADSHFLLGPFLFTAAATEIVIFIPRWSCEITSLRLIWKTAPTLGQEPTVKFGTARPGDAADDNRLVTAVQVDGQNAQTKGHPYDFTVLTAAGANVLDVDSDTHFGEALTMSWDQKTGEAFVEIGRVWRQSAEIMTIPHSPTSTTTTTTTTTTVTTTSTTTITTTTTTTSAV